MSITPHKNRKQTAYWCASANNWFSDYVGVETPESENFKKIKNEYFHMSIHLHLSNTRQEFLHCNYNNMESEFAAGSTEVVVVKIEWTPTTMSQDSQGIAWTLKM